MLHRDVKTSNILLDETGEPLLTDFGLARLPKAADSGGDQPLRPVTAKVQTAIDTDVESNTGPAEESMPSAHYTAPLMGTIHYLAPELFRNQTPDVRSDIYGLGVVLYRMLSGCLPFPGQPHEVAEAIQRRTPPLPSRFEPRIPRELEAICLKAMARQPADRYQSAAEMAEALQQWLQTAPQVLVPSRRRVRVLLAAAAAAVVLAGIVSDWKCGRLRLTVDPPSPSQVAIGWGLPRCDIEGTRFYPVPSKSRLEELAFAESWSVQGEVALTGDIDGDGTLELLIGNGTTLQAYRCTHTATNDAGPELLWQQNDAGNLNLVADVTGSSSPEIITSAGQGDRLILRVFDGRGQQLKELSTAGEIETAPTRFNPKAMIFACAVADLQQDGDKEIIARKTMEGGKRSRGVVVFDYTTGKELYYRNIGPMVGDLSVGKIAGVDIVHATIGPANGVSGADGTVDNRCYIYCWYGRTGRNLWKEPRRLEGEGFVTSNVGLSDLDGDGTLDIVATSFRHVGPGWYGVPWSDVLGRVYLLNSANGNTRPGYQRNFDMGVFFGGTADFDGNGTKDILVSADNAKPPGGRLLLLSPALDLPIVHEFSVLGQHFEACAINDINGDGRPEVIAIAGVPDEEPPNHTLYILDSKLSELWKWHPGGPLRAAIVSDLNGDGVNEIIIHRGDKVSVLTATSHSPQWSQNPNVPVGRPLPLSWLPFHRQNPGRANRHTSAGTNTLGFPARQKVQSQNSWDFPCTRRPEIPAPTTGRCRYMLCPRSPTRGWVPGVESSSPQAVMLTREQPGAHGHVGGKSAAPVGLLNVHELPIDHS